MQVFECRRQSVDVVAEDICKLCNGGQPCPFVSRLARRLVRARRAVLNLAALALERRRVVVQDIVHVPRLSASNTYKVHVFSSSG